jgi:putative oxidoreductase
MGYLKYLSVPNQNLPASLSLLLLRLVCGTAFVLYGWYKIQNPTSWMGPETSMPGFLQLLAAVSEFFGGFAWIIGLLTPLASLGIGCTMAVGVGYIISNGGTFIASAPDSPMHYDAALVYFCVAVVLLFVGPGRFSLDRKIFHERPV